MFKPSPCALALRPCPCLFLRRAWRPATSTARRAHCASSSALSSTAIGTESSCIFPARPGYGSNGCDPAASNVPRVSSSAFRYNTSPATIPKNSPPQLQADATEHRLRLDVLKLLELIEDELAKVVADGQMIDSARPFFSRGFLMTATHSPATASSHQSHPHRAASSCISDGDGDYWGAHT